MPRKPSSFCSKAHADQKNQVRLFDLGSTYALNGVLFLPICVAHSLFGDCVANRRRAVGDV